MALTGKAKDYFEFKKKQSKRSSFFRILFPDKKRGFSARGYAFKKYISADQKDQKTLEMIRNW